MSARAPGGEAAASSARFAMHGDLLDFVAAPAWGEVDSPAVRFRPDHWLLVEGGRIAVVQAEAPDASWTRHEHAGRWILPQPLGGNVEMTGHMFPLTKQLIAVTPTFVVPTTPARMRTSFR